MLHTLFTSRLTDHGPAGQAAYERHVAELRARAAAHFPGFVDVRAYLAEDGERLSVVRFADAESQRAWAQDLEHRLAQARGRERYYDEYRITVCEEVQDHAWKRGDALTGEPAVTAATSPISTGLAPAQDTTERFRETLDPEDWEAFRELAHGMLDRMIDWQRDVAQLPAWRPVPEDVEESFLESVPLEGVGAAAACEDFLRQVLPYPTGCAHPRWWGWAGGTGSPMGMLAAMLGAGMNSVPGNWNDSASRVELQLLDWMKSAMGFPASASGIVTSGGSVANLIGLAVARDTAAPDIGEQGLDPAAGKLTLYASKEVHSSVIKAARLMGLGSQAVRFVGVDDEYRILIPELRALLESDREQGLRPFAVVGNAGAINTGAVDDLDALADLAQEQGLWFHVDGAFGAMAALSPETRQLVSGMERADSLAFDFHKWMYVNYEAGCVLLRDPDAHRRSFAMHGDYLSRLSRGIWNLTDTAGGRGLQLSRGFKALKPWMTLKEHGLAKFGRLVAQNVREARYLAELIDASELLTRVAPVTLNVVAFRYDDPDTPAEERDEINRELLMRTQERGIAIPSSTQLGGRFTLRCCICNHRSRQRDFDEFVEAAESIVTELLGATVQA